MQPLTGAGLLRHGPAPDTVLRGASLPANISI
jgi:hypothetical protein